MLDSVLTVRNISVNWRFVFSHPAHFIAFGFGSGLSPKAPGTAGTLVAIPLYYLLLYGLSTFALVSGLVLALIIGLWACDVAGKALGEADYSGIVWDEIAAFFLVLACIPARAEWVVLAFLLFRLFDIWKPWPISWVDTHMKHAFGVMLDDVMAALLAVLVLRGVLLVV